jgi:hypothetical protein
MKKFKILNKKEYKFQIKWINKRALKHKFCGRDKVEAQGKD